MSGRGIGIMRSMLLQEEHGIIAEMSDEERLAWAVATHRGEYADDMEDADPGDCMETEQDVIFWDSRAGAILGLVAPEYYVIGGDTDADMYDDVSEAEEVAAENCGDVDMVDAAPEEGGEMRDDISASRRRVAAAELALVTCPATLTGIPDILLERVLHFATNKPHQVCKMERACKRIRGLTVGDEFWDRHPKFRVPDDVGERIPTFGLGTNTNEYLFANRYLFNSLPEPEQWPRVLEGSTRQKRFYLEALRKMYNAQRTTVNNIICCLRDEKDKEDNGAEAFTDVSVKLLTKMAHADAPISDFRLRGDTIGYLAEMLEKYLVGRMEKALLMAVQRNDVNGEVKTMDVMATYEVKGIHSHWHTFANLSFDSSPPPKCNIGNKEHNIAAFSSGSSCACPSSGGTTWLWPEDNCHGVLPPEAGRRIIRRLAYMAGVVRMSHEAFLLVEADLLHTMGVLLVDAYESSKKLAQNATYVDENEGVSYGYPSNTVDMFKVPPPPLFISSGDGGDERAIYTVVPGQIRAAAERRNVVPYHVWGDTWVCTGSDLDEKQEKEVEESYYYKGCDEEMSYASVEDVQDSHDDEEWIYANDEEDSDESIGEMTADDIITERLFWNGFMYGTAETNSSLQNQHENDEPPLDPV